MKPIRAVLFDMDGVLVDAQETHRQALRDACKLHGVVIPRAKERSLEGRPTRVKLKMLGCSDELAAVVERDKQQFTLKLAAFYEHDPEREGLLARLRDRGVWTGCVTNSIRKTTEAFLHRAGLLEGLGGAVVTNEDVMNPKPAADCYFKAMLFLGVKPEETVIFEDSPVGLVAARSSGALVCPTSFSLLPDHVRFLLSVLEVRS